MKIILLLLIYSFNSLADIQLRTTAGTCNAGAAGELYYDSVNKLVKLCNGTNWTNVFADAIPSGAIAYFAGSCPANWTEYTNLRGRYVVGVPSGGTLVTAVGTALTNLQNKATGYHRHQADPPNITTPSDQHRHQLHMTAGYGGSSRLLSVGTGGTTKSGDINSGGTHRHTYNLPNFSITSTGTGTGTSAPYIQLRPCQKD